VSSQSTIRAYLQPLPSLLYLSLTTTCAPAMSDQVIYEYNDAGTLVGYSCALLTSPGNTYDPVKVPYYYDLVYPCSTTDVKGKQAIENDLLTSTASLLRMLDADSSGCLVPPPGSAPWIARIDGNPLDEFETTFDCLKARLTPGQCCSVVRGAMTMYPIGAYNLDDLKGLLALQLDDNQFDVFYTHYLGAEVEYSPESGMDAVAPAIRASEVASLEPKGKNITVVGGFVAGSLVASFVGVLLILMQRRRRYLHSKDTELALSRSEDGGKMHITVISDVNTFEDSLGPPPPPPPASTDPYSPGEDDHYKSYKFDLGDSFKNEIAGKYGIPSGMVGPTSMAVVAPYPMEETSDSEVDSWAQTDGTVGSLEERLEEITAEI
jgi:hypothetical protein